MFKNLKVAGCGKTRIPPKLNLSFSYEVGKYINNNPDVDKLSDCINKVLCP